MKDFAQRVLDEGLNKCFLHCCIGKSEKFRAMLDEYIPFQNSTIVERTNDYMIVQLDFGSFTISYKFTLVDAQCNESIYNKRISCISLLQNN